MQLVRENATSCPLHGAPNLSDELVFPLHRRAVLQHARTAAGATELRIFHGDKELSFEEPELFGFAGTLVTRARFRAGETQQWAPDYEWPRLAQILAQLIEAGILVRADDYIDVEVESGPAPAPLPPGPCPMARRWEDAEAITQELGGRAVELGHLELILPIFRVAHIALDGDGRQVGEANVFPPALRMDVPTEWRTCNLPGTRFQSERPMNVTAMRVMRAHWPQMIAAIRRIRAVYLQRVPEAAGAWTVGHVERLATTVLAVPTYQIMRAKSPVEVLHPALSSLFRVTDGVRMVMHQMLFVPIGEPAWSPDDPVSVEAILNYAERNYSYHSEHGVCAGPRAMVRELVAALLEDRADDTLLLPEVEAALADTPAAMDYAMRGLQAYAAVFSLWPAMTRCYARLAHLAADWPATAELAPVQARLQARLATITTGSYLAHERWRAHRDEVYADMYARCGRALGATPVPLATLIAPRTDDALEAQLGRILAARLGLDAARAGTFSAVVADWLLRAQAILRTASAVQRAINTGLGRAAPRRPISLADIDVHNRLQGENPQRLPFLLDELEEVLGASIQVEAERCTITE